MDFGTSKLVGKHLEHIKLEVIDNTSGKVFNARAYGMAKYFEAIHAHKPFDMCYTIEEIKHPGVATAPTITLQVKGISFGDE
jgi:single-stranded-DNA-specific exonuclease